MVSVGVWRFRKRKPDATRAYGGWVCDCPYHVGCTRSMGLKGDGPAERDYVLRCLKMWATMARDCDTKVEHCQKLRVYPAALDDMPSHADLDIKLA